MTFESEVTVPVTVEVLDATRGTPARIGDRPERCSPAEGDSVDLTVMLGGIDVTGALPSDVLEALAADALERLEADAAEP